MDFSTDSARSFGRPGNQDLPLWQSGVCLWFSSWAGALGFRACQEEGTAHSSRERGFVKTSQVLPGIFAVKVREAPEMEQQMEGMGFLMCGHLCPRLGCPLWGQNPGDDSGEGGRPGKQGWIETSRGLLEKRRK